jgi:HEAT repeat protein
MASRAIREEFVAFLKDRNLSELAERVSRNRGTIRYLNRLLYDLDGLVRWRAIEAMGAVADRLAQDNPEAVRVILRNLLWSINDESGGIGWSAPEAIGEIIYRQPERFEEFASIILSFTDEPVLRRGVLWAAGRMAEARPGLVLEALPGLTSFLNDSDPVLRGYTLRLLAAVGERLDPVCYRHLLEDRSPVPVYEDGELKKVTVAELAGRLAS